MLRRKRKPKIVWEDHLFPKAKPGESGFIKKGEGHEDHVDSGKDPDVIRMQTDDRVSDLLSYDEEKTDPACPSAKNDVSGYALRIIRYIKKKKKDK